MAHIHKNIDFTVGAFIVQKGKILLINHKQLKKWLSPGGHIELDEDPEQALYREIKEETGIDKSDLEMLGEKPALESDGTKFLYSPIFLDIHKISNRHRHVGLIYFLKSKTSKIVLAKDEHNNIKWFSPKDLADPQYNLSPAIKFYCSQALEKISS